MTRFMMALVAGSMLVSGSAIAQSARAPGGFYVGGSLGAAVFWDSEVEVVDQIGNVSDEDVEYDLLGFSIAGQAGYFLNDNIRFEGELAYQSTEGEIGNSDIEVTTIRGTISAYYDMNSIAVAGFSGLRPYAGAGIGFINIDPEADDFAGEKDSTELTFQGEVGTSYDLSPNFALVPAMRLEYTGESDEFESTIVSLFKVGVRFTP